MQRVIGIDIHRTFGEAVIWEDGKLHRAGRVDMTRTALEGYGKRLRSDDEVVIEATGNCMAVSRVLSPFVLPLRKGECAVRPFQRRSASPARGGRCAGQSGRAALRAKGAPVTLPTSIPISRSAANEIMSRKTSASGVCSTSECRCIMGSVLAATSVSARRRRDKSPRR